MKSERTKYAIRSITLRTADLVSQAMLMVKNAPVDEFRPLECVVREIPKVRGLDQNGLYWKRLGEIADQAWVKGRQFDADTWHIHCGRTVMPETVTNKDGLKCSKWVPMPDGSVRVISTTKLEKGCFAEYVTAVESFGSSLGVRFSANERMD